MRFSYELVAAALAAQRVLAVALPPQRRDVAKVQTIPLTVVYASENNARFDGTYTGNILFGTPPQSFQLQLDTGSPDTHVFAAASGNPPPFYDPSASSTFVNTTSPYIFEYGGPDPDLLTNVTGFVARDTVSFGEFTSVGQTFAVATGASPGQLDPNAQGILGLAFNDAVSNFHQPVYIQTLIDDGQLFSPEFGLHLQRASDLGAPAVPDGAGEATIQAGEITIGGVDTTKFTGDITYALVTVPAFWQIAIEGIVLGGTIVPGTAMDAAVDCGTSIIVIPPALATTLYAEIPGSEVIEEGGIYAIPCDTTLDVGIKIAGTTFPIKVQDLSQGFLDEAGTQCVVGIFGFDADNASSNGTYPSGKPDVIILGLPFLKSVYSIFDYSNGGRVGFATLVDNGDGPFVGPIGAQESGNPSGKREVKKVWKRHN